MKRRILQKKTWYISGLSAALVVVGILSSAILVNQEKVSAYTAGFNAGRIMDDYIFTNNGTMNVSQIQAFLNSKVTSCDTAGTRPASDYGRPDLTHAQYAAMRGWSAPPYTCLKDFSEGGRSGAQIIYDTAQQFRINPQVLLVVLQKEQGLVTDTWPTASQYRTATGYGCPDTPAGCDAKYFGFTNQTAWTGRMYRAIMDQSPTWYSPYVLGNNFVLYNPNRDCGGSTVNIQNLATVALYDYTPYQPNQAALDAGYGTGDACSSHGNRNFYSYFTDWFGTTTSPAYEWQLTGTEYYTDAARTNRFSFEPTVQPGGKIYIRVKARNTGNITWTPSVIRLGTSGPRDHIGLFRDDSWPYPTRPAQLKEASVKPYETGTFEFSITAPSSPGAYKEYYSVVAEGTTWLNDIGAYYSFNVVTPTSPPAPASTILKSGESLDRKKSLVGPLGQTSLDLQGDGNLILSHDYRPLWTTATGNSQAKQLTMQTDGNLVLYDTAGHPLWFTGTGGNPGAQLVMQLDGNLVLYSADGAPLWQSGTVHNPGYLSYVNTTLYPGKLLRGQWLDTADRRYRLALQNDGNLVLYSPTRALWATLTDGSAAAYLAMQQDGNLVLYDYNDRPIWQSGTNDRGISALVLQQDGNLVTYQGMAFPTWSTRTGGQ